MSAIHEQELAKIVHETENIFIGLSLVFQDQLGPIAESSMYYGKKAFFRPLVGRRTLDSELYCTRILRALVEQCRSSGGSDHLFLKNASPSLRKVLESGGFGDSSPLITELVKNLPRLYSPESKSKGSFWRLKALIEYRARQAVKSRSRNYQKLARALLRVHLEESLLVVL